MTIILAPGHASLAQLETLYPDYLESYNLKSNGLRSIQSKLTSEDAVFMFRVGIEAGDRSVVQPPI